MPAHALEVAIDRTGKASFVTASQSFIDTVLAPLFAGHVPRVAALRVMGAASGQDVYVGCLTDFAHSLQKSKLRFPICLAQDLGLTEGQLIECVPLSMVPRATQVLVAPLTVDDSEVVEHNALRIENQLLQQVQVVFPAMVITVAIYAGVQAKVKVQKIECGPSGETITSGCATMFEGTQFVIATRMRQSEKAEDSTGAKPPAWAFLRGLPASGSGAVGGEAPAGAGAAAATPADLLASGTPVTVKVHPRTAERFGWKAGTVLDSLDLSHLVTLEESAKITPSFLRLHVVPATVVVEESVAEGTCTAPHLQQATNLLLSPPMTASEAAAAPASATGEEGGGGGEGGKTGASATTRPSSRPVLVPPPSALPIADVVAVHGSGPQEVLDHLRYVLHRPLDDSDEGDISSTLAGNVLLCGGKGYGKTTVAASVVHAVPEAHAVFLECTTDKGFLPELHRALAECVLCAPSLLVLDNFDVIAPAQQDGNVQALSAATKAALESALVTFAHGFSVMERSTVVVVATCGSREAVHECFRSAACFQKVVTIDALTRVTRCTLLSQLFPGTSTDEIGEVAALMDNYTPFDVRQVSNRIRSRASAGQARGEAPASLLERARQSVETFTPLAHTGIKFLKGEKVSWGDIGGLTEAKKVLYDTLVLPMKHPQLFARLPLKTRSGILLYGPSGCGKTFIIEALVNAENLNCIVVNGPEVFGKYIGESEQKIRDYFERAQAAAPCVVFFDEFDSVAPQRGVDNSGVTDRVVNQLLCYLDGVEGRKDVFVVAASSRPDLIDAALLRPGRLDKAVQCPVPSQADRAAILRHLFSKVTADFTPDEVEAMAAETENWTPADLSAMVSSANMLVSQRVMESLSLDTAVTASEDGFFVANVGNGLTHEKVADAVRVLTRGGGTGGDDGHHHHHQAAPVMKMTKADIEKAMATTRPSLSQKDIEKQKRIHDLFSKGKTVVPKKPGTKLTSS